MVVRLLALIVMPVLGQAQKIENLRHELFNSDIVITYDLTNTVPSQQFLVKAVCQNGPQTIPLQSVDGNGMGSVRGGTNRQIIWNVLRDVPELVGDKITFTLTVLSVSSDPEGPVKSRSITDRKAILYNELTAQTNVYLEQVYNLVIAFEMFGKRAFQNKAELRALVQQVTITNNVYEKIFQNKDPFLQQIRSLWGSETLNGYAERFFERSLDQMHRSQLLPFNQILSNINDVASGTLRPGDRKKLIKSIEAKLETRIPQLKEEVGLIKANANVFYSNLRQ